MKTSVLDQSHGFHKTTSMGYRCIGTRDVLNVFHGAGYRQTDFQVSRVNNKERDGYQKHLVRLTHDNLSLVNGVRPEIVLVNSHDGTNALKIYLGAYRFVCENGLMTGTQFDTFRIIHKGRHVAHDVKTAIDRSVERLPIVANTINQWQQRELTTNEKIKFASDVAKHLTKNIDGLVYDNVLHFLKPKRSIDAANDLFTVYNVIQENTMLGGMRYLTQRDGKIRANRLRKIQAIDKKVNLNRFIWDTANQFVA